MNYIVKIASRCNLNCSYCYVYNQADSTWRERPSLMSRETFVALVERIRRHCLLSGQPEVIIAFHGGEPTLAGSARFDWMCAYIREELRGIAQVTLSVQTNGTRLDDGWLAVLAEHQVDVGVSLDGPREVNDVARVDRKGRGSYDATARGIAMLRDAGFPFGIISVVQPGGDALAIHRHFISLGCKSISYLLPGSTHDTIGDVRERYGPTPCADYLIPIFDEWWFNETIEVTIREFWNLARVIMGAQSHVEMIGNPRLHFLTVETDGSMQGLELLRACEDGMCDMSLNVHDADFSQIAEASPFHGQVMAGMPLPTECRGCTEQETCAGGHLTHRYSRARGFDNRSVWCADLLKLFAHVRKRLDVSPEETERRRADLDAARAERTRTVQLV